MANEIRGRWGWLNSFRGKRSQKRLIENRISAMREMREAALKQFTVDSLETQGPLKGIVLRDDTNRRITPGNWLYKYGIVFPGTTSLPQYRVRIPELHSALPSPTYFVKDEEGNKGEEWAKNNRIIDMYPLFEANSTDLKGVEPGTIVWVDFGDRQNMTEPFFIGPIKPGEVVVNVKNGLKSSDVYGDENMTSEVMGGGENCENVDDVRQKIIDAYPNSEPIVDKMIALSERLGANPIHFANLINFETSGTFSTSVQNSIKATGLIQFIPSTAADLLGLNPKSEEDKSKAAEIFKNMSVDEQMGYVEKYMTSAPRKTPMNTEQKLYMAVFYPSYQNKPIDSVFPSKVIKDNNGISTPQDYIDYVNKYSNLKCSEEEA